MNQPILSLTLGLATLIISNMMFSHTTNAQSSVQINRSYSISQHTSTSQSQTTAVSLDSTQLRSPHVLRISAPVGTNLSGRVVVNGKVINQFGKQGVSINLSPYLSRGSLTVEIIGRYTPVQSQVRVSFSGPETQVNQQSGGNGVLRQTLVFDVD